MTESEFRTEIKGLSGGYLFFGNEDYLKYTYSREVRKNVLDGTFDEFNHIVIYAEEYTPEALDSAIQTLPMMAERKLVEVRGVNFNSMKKDDISALESVLASLKDNDHTVLLIRADSDYFNAGRLPKSPSEIFRMMSRYITPVELNFPGQSRLRSWIMRHFSDGEIEFNPDLCELLVEICGHNMWALANEIDKLCLYAKSKGQKSIDKETIELVCCKTIEFDDFQLTNALLARDRELVFETLYRQRCAHEPPMAILSSVIRLYSELSLVQRLLKTGMNKAQISQSIGVHEFKVGKYITSLSGMNPKKIERALELCREADLKSKSASNVTSYIAVERLLCSVCALICR